MDKIATRIVQVGRFSTSLLAAEWHAEAVARLNPIGCTFRLRRSQNVAHTVGYEAILGGRATQNPLPHLWEPSYVPTLLPIAGSY